MLTNMQCRFGNQSIPSENEIDYNNDITYENVHTNFMFCQSVATRTQ